MIQQLVVKAWKEMTSVNPCTCAFTEQAVVLAGNCKTGS